MAKPQAQQIDIDLQIRNAIKTGDVRIGSRQVLRACEKGEARLLVLSHNCPSQVREAVAKYDVSQYIYPGGSVELGPACGKPFLVAAIAVVNPGESAVMWLASEV